MVKMLKSYQFLLSSAVEWEKMERTKNKSEFQESGLLKDMKMCIDKIRQGNKVNHRWGGV